MTLTITGTIVDKEGKPIDKTHAEWMVHQFLTLLKWCGLHFHGSVADAQHVDIYRTGVVDLPAPVVEKPIRVRHKYARQEYPTCRHPTSHIYIRDGIPGCDDCDAARRRAEAGRPLLRVVKDDALPSASGLDAHAATCIRCNPQGQAVKGGGVVKSEAEDESAQRWNGRCQPGSICSVGGVVLIVCAVCRRHVRRELVNTDTNRCHTCQGVEGKVT